MVVRSLAFTFGVLITNQFYNHGKENESSNGSIDFGRSNRVGIFNLHTAMKIQESVENMWTAIDGVTLSYPHTHKGNFTPHLHLVLTSEYFDVDSLRKDLMLFFKNTAYDYSFVKSEGKMHLDLFPAHDEHGGEVIYFRNWSVEDLFETAALFYQKHVKEA